MKTCGIYKITCNTSGRFYIGSAANIYKRKKRHFKSLRDGTHHNVFFQRVFDKYGEADFSLRYSRTATLEEAREREQLLLDKYHGDPRFMNIGRDATGGDNLTNNPNRRKIVKKMTKAVREHMDSLSAEERKVKFGRPGSKNGMFGKTHTEEVKRNLSKQHTGNHYNLGVAKSAEHKEALSASKKLLATQPGYVNPFKGKKHSVETLAFLATVNVGKIPANARKIKIGKKKFKSLTEAGRQLGVVTATILYRIRSDNYPEYTYVD